MQRAGKRLTARRASQGMAVALAKRRNTAGGCFTARSRALAAKVNRPLKDLDALAKSVALELFWNIPELNCD